MYKKLALVIMILSLSIAVVETTKAKFIESKNIGGNSLSVGNINNVNIQNNKLKDSHPDDNNGFGNNDKIKNNENDKLKDDGDPDLNNGFGNNAQQPVSYTI